MKKAVVWNDISFAYENRLVLTPSSFSVEEGTMVGIMGPNGGGKTTLLKILMGFLKPASGSVSLYGKSPPEFYPNISYVPQFLRSDREFPINVEEIVRLGCLHDPGREAFVVYWMEKLGLMDHRKKRYGALSGGLAQRALLARSLVSDPSILLLDEPTASIDPPSANAILDILESLKGSKTILLVTHDVKTIIERVDQILSVQGAIQTYLPGQVCEHFAMGLYHTPLLDLPKNHWKKDDL
jgi:zinc transport system ATP-binding protein